MARNIRWFVQFKSLNGTNCRINIYDNDWPEGVTLGIRGAADPFYYEEDDSDDLLNDVLRYRTGYIRVIEDYYGQLDDIRPATTFDRYVEFLYGGVVVFNGYIQVQDFSHTLEFSTQQDPCPHVVEFPVISPLGLFDKRTFPYIMPPTTKTIGQLLDMILANGSYQKVTLPNITSVGFWQTLYSLVVCPWDKDYHHSMTEDAMHKVLKPQSYAYLIEGICKAFGWICHDTPQALIFTMFDHEGLYCYYPVGHIGDANYKQNESIGSTAVALTDYYTLADNNARVDTLLPDTGIEINYEGDLGKVDFTFQRTRFYGIERDPNDTGDPDEVFSVCNLFPVANLWEIENVGYAQFDSQGRIDYCNAVVAWHGNVGVLSSLSTSDQDGHVLFTLRLYTKNPAGCSWVVSFDGMASSDGLGTYHSGIGGLRDDKKVTEYYVQTESTVHNDYFEVTFKYRYSNVQGSSYPQLPDHTLIFVHNIKFTFTENNEPYAEYKFTPANKADVIPTGTYPKVSSSVTMPISLYRLNTNMIGDTLMTTKLTEYPYLLQKRQVLSGTFRPATAQAPDLFHARLWSYLSKKWRLIAQTFHPWDDEYQLTLQSSPILDVVKYNVSTFAEHTNMNGYSEQITSGGSFHHILTADSGYLMSEVEIKMGGVNITSSAYNQTTGDIDISRVTGDIVVTTSTVAATSVVGMVTKRQTAGGRTLVSNNAQLNAIYGQTLVWNQKRPDTTPTKYGNYTLDWYSADDETITLSDFTLSTSGNTYYQIYINPYRTEGHVYYISAEVYCDTDSQQTYARWGLAWTGTGSSTSGSGYSTSRAKNKWVTIHDISTPTGSSQQVVRFVAYNAQSGSGRWFTENTVIRIRNFRIIDLTAMFGAGNEPTAEADFEKLFPMRYEAYSSALTLNNKMSAYVSKDSDDETLQTASINVTTLTGKLNGAGTSVTIFPGGMKSSCNESVDDTYDEIKKEDGVWIAIKRCGDTWISNNQVSGKGEWNILTDEEVYVIDQSLADRLIVGTGGTEEISPSNGDTPSTAPAVLDISYGVET